MSVKRRTAIPVATAVLLGSPLVAQTQPRLKADRSQAASDASLLQDEDKAKAELERRLRNQATYRDGVLVLIDRSGGGGVTVMPATVIWGVECGDEGLIVTFGSGSGDTDNGVMLTLTGAAISDDKCTRIAPAIGLAVLAVTKGH
jgi:hypothetical protein